jgi:vitamin B12 transporter
MHAYSRRLLAAAVSICVSQAAAQAQSVPTPDIVVTATRTPLAISQAGSAISVITAEEIAKVPQNSIVEVFRRVPGLTVNQSGGPGSATTVRIRGAEARQTLVLIDGVRVNDPAQGSNEFDFANLMPVDIERIEVLRGPQSALYGSDAMGGVINIITRKGRGAPRFSTGTEVGSYGSKGARAAVSGGTDRLSYAFSLTGYDTAGFSRYGYRIGRIERTRLWPLEADSARQLGASGRVGVSLTDNVELEVGGYASLNKAQYDLPFDDTPSFADQGLAEGHARLTALTLDGLLRNTVLISASRTDRTYNEVSAFCRFPDFVPVWCRDNLVGDRTTAQYQGDLKLGPFGLLTFGAAIEREGLRTSAQDVQPVLTPWRETSDVARSTRSAFALHQISLWENLHLSLSGRVDDVENVDTFATWRATAAYEIPATGTIFRTSVGTGAKAPTLFQLYDPSYGSPGLQPERSLGVDGGIDQRLFDDRLTLSATVFLNRFRDLIDFVPDPSCPPTALYGCYVNVARARTSGLELAADLDIVPAWLRLKLAYTYLSAIDLRTEKHLARRPENEGRVGFIITPVRDLSIEPAVVFVGERFSSLGQRDRLAPYARLDLYADYRINDTFSVYARAENLTDARYQEIRDYGTAGRAFYGGLRATW